MLDDLYHAELKAEEHIWLIALDTKCKPIGIFETNHGSVNSSVVSPREIFVRLCLCGAAHFIIAHNHPSGDPAPSKEDMEVTRRMGEAGKIMNIGLLDHIIIGDGCYWQGVHREHPANIHGRTSRDFLCLFYYAPIPPYSFCINEWFKKMKGEKK